MFDVSCILLDILQEVMFSFLEDFILVVYEIYTTIVMGESHIVHIENWYVVLAGFTCCVCVPYVYPLKHQWTFPISMIRKTTATSLYWYRSLSKVLLLKKREAKSVQPNEICSIISHFVKVEIGKFLNNARR